MASIDDYPEIMPFLDNTDDYVNTATETNLNGNRLLVVTQVSEFDGGQLVFRWDGENWQLVDTDTFVDLTGNERIAVVTRRREACSNSSDEDHRTVHEHMVDSVNSFSSASGPDGGNLACVWAVRHIVHQALGHWITRTDGTAIFDVELQNCYGSTWQDQDTPAGGIIISPTVTMASGRRNIGHVGLLGPGGTGEGRLIYSNSSSRKRWEQNFTLAKWIANYRTRKRLKIRFYPLPFYS